MSLISPPLAPSRRPPPPMQVRCSFTNRLLYSWETGAETQQRPWVVCVSTDKHLKRHPSACGPYKGFRASFIQKSVLWKMERKTLASFMVSKGFLGK